jgi:hypothetical protein
MKVWARAYLVGEVGRGITKLGSDGSSMRNSIGPGRFGSVEGREGGRMSFLRSSPGGKRELTTGMGAAEGGGRSAGEQSSMVVRTNPKTRSSSSSTQHRSCVCVSVGRKRSRKKTDGRDEEEAEAEDGCVRRVMPRRWRAGHVSPKGASRLVHLAELAP